MRMTDEYRRRPVDARMVQLIADHVPAIDRLLDLGCGSGLYGEALKARCRTLVGFDYDADLCALARSRGAYDEVVQGDIRELPRLVPSVDAIFCSEILEHVPNAEIATVLA